MNAMILVHEIAKVLTQKKHVLRFDFGGQTVYAYNSVLPAISFVSPTLANATTTPNTSIIINVSINSSTMSSFIYNWNGTIYNISENNLVLFMNFNNVSAVGDAARNFTDLSPRNKSGTCAGTICPTYVTSGKYGGAVYFNASKSTMINITSTPSTSTYTVAAWIYPIMTNVDDGCQDITFASANAQFQYSSNSAGSCGSGCATNRLLFWNGANDICSTSGMTTLSWHFIALTSNAGTYTFYIDGSSAGTGSSAPSGAWKTIGGDSSFSEHFDGYIDELRIYNRSLSASELTQVYNSNLYKYAADGWNYEVNQTSLTNGTYTYYANVTDVNAATNQTDLRYVTIGTASSSSTLAIGFVYPTLANNTITYNKSLMIMSA